MRLVSFGSGTNSYTFPAQSSMDTNFANPFSRFRSPIGADGVYDGYGYDRALGQLGQIRASFWLIANPPTTEITELRDNVYAMQSWGRRKLVMQPYDSNEDTRFCYARINSITMPENVSARPDLRQLVEVVFDTPEPYWYGQGTEAALWGHFNWGDGTVWGGTSTPQAVSGTSTQYNITVGGNQPTYPRIRFTVTAGQNAENPFIRRISGTSVVDEIALASTTLGSGTKHVWETNARTKRVTINGADAYDNNFGFMNADWFTLYPGINKIRVTMANGGDAGELVFKYYEVYK